MRLTMLIPTMGAGGAERVLSTMAGYWAAKGWQITVLSLASQNDRPFYPLHPAVQYRPLDAAAPSHNVAHAVRQNITRIATLRRALKATRPQLIISLIDQMNVLTLLASSGMSTPVVVAEHNDLWQHDLKAQWIRLRNITYRQADRVIVLTPKQRDYFSTSVRRRVRAIPNPVLLNTERHTLQRHTNDTTRRTIIAVGRLARQKGFDMLISAFSQIAASHPNWTLTIWGEGEDRDQLTTLIQSLGLLGRVHLPGVTHQPFEEMRGADLFVLSSRYEGFPMVLCEAMACGLPVVSFDCPSGPSDIIRDGVDGMLVPAANVEVLAQTMSTLMHDSPTRQRLSEQALAVTERFGVEPVMALWDQVVEEVV